MKTAKISKNVDYLTLTAQGREEATALIEAALPFGNGLNEQLPIQTPWHFKGYRGWKQEGMAYGTRNAGDAIVQLWGLTAHTAYRTMYDYATSCTRIDLAVTVELTNPDKLVAVRAYNLQTEAKKTKSTLFLNNRGGATCYLGSRTSRHYGRLYDKGAESNKEPGVFWRYELEVKKPASMIVFRQLIAAKSPGDFIIAAVYDFFVSRGVEPEFTPTIPYDAIEIPRNLTSPEKKLQWLEKQVQPAVRQLWDLGLRSEVLIALGFNPIHPDWKYHELQEVI